MAAAADVTPAITVTVLLLLLLCCDFETSMPLVIVVLSDQPNFIS